MAPVGRLIALKLLSESESRIQDRADLNAHLKVARAAELNLARAAIKAVSDRGFSGARDLGKALARFLNDVV